MNVEQVHGIPILDHAFQQFDPHTTPWSLPELNLDDFRISSLETSSTTDETLMQDIFSHFGRGGSGPDQKAAHCCPDASCVSKAERKVYARKGDLARHKREQHGTEARKYLCHVKECPRGIAGQGFNRMNQLVGHLRSRQHRLTPQRAKYEAAKFNPRWTTKNAVREDRIQEGQNLLD